MFKTLALRVGRLIYQVAERVCVREIAFTSAKFRGLAAENSRAGAGGGTRGGKEAVACLLPLSMGRKTGSRLDARNAAAN